MTLDRIFDIVDLKSGVEDYSVVLNEFKKNIEEWALSILPSEISYSKDGWLGADTKEEAAGFNQALEEVRESILKETKI